MDGPRSRFAWLRILGVTVLALGAAFAVNAMNETGTRAASKFTVQAGGGGRGISVEMFRPKNIFIHAGDSVEFVNPYEEIHTVTFLGDKKTVPELIIPAGPPPKAGPPKLIFNPEAAFPTSGTSYTGAYANSGIIGKGQSFTLSFSTLGTYNFLCILHPGMEGTVQVLDAGTTVPTQAAYDAEAKVQLDRAIAAGEASAKATKTTNTKLANGSTNYGVAVPQSAGLSDVMQFTPVSLDIAVGDSVTWNNNTPVPHTVTYAAGTTPELTVPEPQAGGPPNLVLNPAVLFASQPPVTSFSGAGYVNSGFMGTGPEANAGTSFSLTFSKPGTYLFICVLHADQGMSSIVKVGGGGATGPVTPPSTGEAGLAENRTSIALYGFAAVVAFAFVAGAGVLRVRAAKR
ncbi:MAG: plastocyanin/azurin family copper-binding protein [Dehalococcoidia bacterium]